MDKLKVLFPISFKYADSVANLIIGILIYVVGSAIAGVILGWLSAIPIVGLIFSLVGSVLGIYCLAGIVIEVLLFVKVLK